MYDFSDLDEINNLVELKEKYNKKLPVHVGIIPDGNRRWIKIQGIRNTLNGHLAGYKTLKNILFPLFDAGVKYLSVYALSSENIRNRSKREVKYLYKLMLKGIKDVLNDPLIHKRQVQIKIIGRIKELPQDILNGIKKLENSTGNYNKRFINICINYDGQEEIIDTVKNLIGKGYSQKDITKEIFKTNLYSKDFPELDYIIRTGMKDGARISGFLIWDSSYAEFRFRNELWPNYNKKMLLEDLKVYIRRNRRKGS